MPSTRGAGARRSALRRLRLSRLLARVLRHKPEDVGLTLDAEGFVELGALARALAAQPGWEEITAGEVASVAAADPRRYELRDGRIRARYGHTVQIQAPGTPALPPEWLYCGVPWGALAEIRAAGLRPGARQYVHLATTPAEAAAVARRHADDVVVVAVRARPAHDAGIVFWRAGPQLYLTGPLPPAVLLIPDGAGWQPATPQASPPMPVPSSIREKWMTDTSSSSDTGRP
ncbi:MAG: RNA 2'-phosphotransferase [Armatimonadota bacterium]|nr:RNA 2'-phosphotransferase [Armatimonadota bacterium]MDR7486917.1 RNA 2'-phosphotransferase [Armatimonadota bacterium]MDR7534535.1 RNA 2'-phosphotransferase [Armatimonadota bacterium]MDR7537628.1 RNA 2'-phosphotransferase [Armatimonadota bacterium]